MLKKNYLGFLFPFSLFSTFSSLYGPRPNYSNLLFKASVTWNCMFDRKSYVLPILIPFRCASRRVNPAGPLAPLPFVSLCSLLCTGFLRAFPPSFSFVFSLVSLLLTGFFGFLFPCYTLLFLCFLQVFFGYTLVFFVSSLDCFGLLCFTFFYLSVQINFFFNTCQILHSTQCTFYCTCGIFF